MSSAFFVYLCVLIRLLLRKPEKYKYICLCLRAFVCVRASVLFVFDHPLSLDEKTDGQKHLHQHLAAEMCLICPLLARQVVLPAANLDSRETEEMREEEDPLL